MSGVCLPLQRVVTECYPAGLQAIVSLLLSFHSVLITCRREYFTRHSVDLAHANLRGAVAPRAHRDVHQEHSLQHKECTAHAWEHDTSMTFLVIVNGSARINEQTLLAYNDDSEWGSFNCEIMGNIKERGSYTKMCRSHIAHLEHKTRNARKRTRWMLNP